LSENDDIMWNGDRLMNRSAVTSIRNGLTRLVRNAFESDFAMLSGIRTVLAG